MICWESGVKWIIIKQHDKYDGLCNEEKVWDNERDFSSPWVIKWNKLNTYTQNEILEGWSVEPFQANCIKLTFFAIFSLLQDLKFFWEDGLCTLTDLSSRKGGSVSCSVVSNSWLSRGLYLARLHCPWSSLDNNIGVGSHSLLQGIFPPGIKPRCPALQADSLPPEPPGKPTVLAYDLK